MREVLSARSRVRPSRAKCHALPCDIVVSVIPMKRWLASRVAVKNSSGFASRRAAGALTVTSNLTDSTTSTALNYDSTNSNLGSLSTLGISVNQDGTLSLDVSKLDSVLNSDFNGVFGFFQSADSWGRSFANILNNAGTNSSVGMLTLALKANSSTESNLNDSITREEKYIADQQKLLTTQLNTANQILQALPTQLDSINQIYSAITGYNSSK